ncbi:MAG: hypothetical protein JW720_13220 [Sedimentisphaerales bacterium]|nr:hypothetical protein [Sedimentisphaerales bacterium]
MLTEKDYEAIADAIAEYRAYNQLTEDDLVNRLAEYFEKENPNFSRKKFARMCNPF